MFVRTLAKVSDVKHMLMTPVAFLGYFK